MKKLQPFRISIQYIVHPEARQELTSTSYLDIAGTTEVWRISMRVPFLGPSKFTELNASQLNLVQQTLNHELPDQSHRIEHTGVSRLYYVAQDELIKEEGITSKTTMNNE